MLTVTMLMKCQLMGVSLVLQVLDKYKFDQRVALDEKLGDCLRYYNSS